MAFVFLLIALVVGIVCGAAIGIETRDLRNQPTGWRPWLLFAGTVLIVAGASAAIERVNEIDPPSTLFKGLSLIAGAVAFSIALYFARKKR